MATVLKTKVLKHVERNKEEIISFLQKLIKIPSATGNEKDIQEFISKKLKQMGLSIRARFLISRKLG